MCRSNHDVLANPGYLWNTDVRSIGMDGVLFTRMLAHADEVGLNSGQIGDLLAINGEYRARHIELGLAFVQTGAELERCDLRTAEGRARAEALLARRRELFAQHERLFIDTAKQADDLLTDDQIVRIEAVWRNEANDMMVQLAPALERATGLVVEGH